MHLASAPSTTSTHVHLEMIGGLAGDMFLAAALDADLVTRAQLEEAMTQMGLGEITITQEVVDRCGIRASHVRFSGWAPEQEADHRHLSEIEGMIQDSALASGVKTIALALFNELGRAESFIHQIPMERVHFHEIGAIDSILDFVGAAYVIHAVNGTWSCDRVPQGTGVIEVAHGVVPAMAPATAKLLEGFELQQRDVDAELVTPTGAAILRYLDAQAHKVGAGRLNSSGYGAGTKSFPHMANVVRVSVYEKASGATTHDLEHQQVVRLCAELDDVQPEVIAWVADALLEAGALDVVRTPVLMKKGRAGVQLAVLCHPHDADALTLEILTQTSTLGVRREVLTRTILPRRIEQVQTLWGPVAVKVTTRGGRTDAQPEFDSCSAIATAHNVPIRRVYQHAIAAALNLSKGDFS